MQILVMSCDDLASKPFLCVQSRDFTPLARLRLLFLQVQQDG